jgi:hypothetical protein
MINKAKYFEILVNYQDDDYILKLKFKEIEKIQKRIRFYNIASIILAVLIIIIGVQ